MNRPAPIWLAGAIRRIRVGLSPRYIAYAIGISPEDARRFPRSLNQCGRLHDRHHHEGRASK